MITGVHVSYVKVPAYFLVYTHACGSWQRTDCLRPCFAAMYSWWFWQLHPPMLLGETGRQGLYHFYCAWVGEEEAKPPLWEDSEGEPLNFGKNWNTCIKLEPWNRLTATDNHQFIVLLFWQILRHEPASSSSLSFCSPAKNSVLHWLRPGHTESLWLQVDQNYTLSCCWQHKGAVLLAGTDCFRSTAFLLFGGVGRGVPLNRTKFLSTRRYCLDCSWSFQVNTGELTNVIELPEFVAPPDALCVCVCVCMGRIRP